MHLACAPSVGPGYDGRRAGEPPHGRPRQNGATYDLWTAALAAHPDVVIDHELQRVGRGHADRARPGPARLPGYDGAWGLDRDAGPDGVPAADDVLGGAAFTALR